MINRLPPWFRQNLPSYSASSRMRYLCDSNVNTVCKEAGCPNFGECFDNLRLTFMILGGTCTRNCRFCNVKKSKGKPLGVDLDEPQRIAEVVKKFGLEYVVITSVTRDDLWDGGASIFSGTIELVQKLNKDIKVEVLIPDFKARLSSLKCVLDAHPDVVAHNIETVKRLYPYVRPQADYRRSLEVLNKIRKLSSSLITKSSIMLGLGETEDDLIAAMKDLIGVHCDILTLGQYLAPSGNHYPVKEFITPQRFMEYRDIGVNLGFKAVLSGPLVRSSYQAEELYNDCSG